MWAISRHASALARECHELCVWHPAYAGFSRGHAWKRSANMISNWLRAANHSRTTRTAFLDVADGEIDQRGGHLLGRE